MIHEGLCLNIMHTVLLLQLGLISFQALERGGILKIIQTICTRAKLNQTLNNSYKHPIDNYYTESESVNIKNKKQRLNVLCLNTQR